MKRTLRETVLRVGLAFCWIGAWLAPSARAQSFADVDATYETRVGGGELRRWVFSRRGAERQYHFVDREISERWRRDARDNASYTRVFHREKTLVRYTHGDLLAIGVNADWSRLSHVVAPPSEAGFVRGKASRAFGYEAFRYHGELGGKRLEVVWIEALGIPAEVRVTAPGRPRIVVKLVELGAAPALVATPTDYRQIDFTDFGDMERDPFVRRHHDDPRPSGVPSLAVHEPLPQPKAALAHRH